MNINSIHIVERKRLFSALIKKLKQFCSLIGFEAFIWLAGLAYLIFINIPGGTHFTICPLSNLGFGFCPGCGLGNSISYIFHGDFISSINSHPLGIFALIVLTLRIITIIKNNWRRYA